MTQKIQVLVLDDAPISGWSSVQSSRAVVRVMSHREVESNLKTPFTVGVCDVLVIVDAPLHGIVVGRSIAALHPKLVLEVASKDDLHRDLKGLHFNFKDLVSSESYGSPFIFDIVLGCWHYNRLGIKVPRPLYGPIPGPATSPAVLWPLWFEGLGDVISRDAYDVVSYVSRAIRGEAPLWAMPGYPVLLPQSPVEFQDLGTRHRGILCQRSGGFVVLTAQDLLVASGIDPSPYTSSDDAQIWQELRRLIPQQVAATLIEWSIDQIEL